MTQAWEQGSRELVLRQQKEHVLRSGYWDFNGEPGALPTAVYVTWTKSFSCSVLVSPGALLGMLLKSCPPSSTALSQFCILGNVSESRKCWCQCSLVPRTRILIPALLRAPCVSWGRSGSPPAPLACPSRCRCQGAERPGQDQAAAFAGAGEPGGLHQRPPVRLARPLRRAAPAPAHSAEHHLADDRADPVHQALRHGQDRQPAAGDAARRSVPGTGGAERWVGWGLASRLHHLFALWLWANP